MGPSYMWTAAIAVLPAVGAYGAHSYRGQLFPAYFVYLVISIGFRIWICLYAGAFLFLSSVLVILLDGWAVRVTVWASAALRACSEAERAEMRTAVAERRMPMPYPGGGAGGMIAV